MPPRAGSHGPGLLFHQHGLHILCTCEAVLSILGWFLCKYELDLSKQHGNQNKETKKEYKSFVFLMCVYPGGGIRDSRNNLMEETSDTGGMFIVGFKDVWPEI